MLTAMDRLLPKELHALKSLIPRTLASHWEAKANRYFQEASNRYTQTTFSKFSQWPIDDHTRLKIESALKNNKLSELVVGHVVDDAFCTGVFGPIPFFHNLPPEDVRERQRRPLDIVVVNNLVLIRKSYRGDMAALRRELLCSALLYGKANVPPVYRVDWEKCALYKNLIFGKMVRDLLLETGVRILNSQTATDPELQGLSNDERIQRVWARGRQFIAKCVSPRTFDALEAQIKLIHEEGITGFSITWGNVILSGPSQEPWIIDFDNARVHFHRWTPSSLWRRADDKYKYFKNYGRHVH